MSFSVSAYLQVENGRLLCLMWLLLVIFLNGARRLSTHCVFSVGTDSLSIGLKNRSANGTCRAWQGHFVLLRKKKFAMSWWAHAMIAKTALRFHTSSLASEYRGEHTATVPRLEPSHPTNC